MDFNALLQQAQQLTTEVTGVPEVMPRVLRTVPQVLEATHDLHSRVTQTGAQDIQAHILLGSKGIDLPKISQQLDTLSTRKTFEPLDPIADTDIHSYLKNERENAILSIIEEVNKKTFEAAEKTTWHRFYTEWREEKHKLLNAMVGSSQNWIDLEKMPELTTLNDTFEHRSSLNNIEMAYAREVFEYNRVVVKGAQRPNLVQIFAKAALNFNDQKVNEIWEIMKYMVNVTPVSRQRDPIESRSEMTQFATQAKKYLENRYKVYMSTIIGGHLREAQRGGVPGIFNLVSTYVALLFNQSNSFGLQDTVEGKPLWPMVYYCLRCGDFPAALRCMQLSGVCHEELVQAIMEKINKPEQKINSKLESQLKIHYCNKIKNSTDPYKKAVYCVIGGCDLNDQHSEVAKTTDDFIWIQLSILRPNDSMNATEGITYAGLQTMILEKYGEEHFNANEQRHLYFQVLALTGQFEAAIEFLARTEMYRAHAVHIAVALNEMFLIGGPQNVQAPLLTVDLEDPVPMRRLNIARLLMLYVRRFQITDSSEAMQYFFFLRNLVDPEGRNLFLVCVSDLVLESRNYDYIFGKMQPNGVLTTGLFTQFDCATFDTRTAASMVADELVRKGMFEDAVKLFDIAGMQDQTIRYMSLLLSQVVSQPVLEEDSLRVRLAIQANEFSQRLEGNRIDCDPQSLATFNLLVKLLKFFDYYHDRNHQPALEILTETKLLPMSPAELELCNNNFKRLSGELCKVFPDLMLAAMDILHLQYKYIKGKETSVAPDPCTEQKLRHFRQTAKALSNMAATVPYRMPCDINKRLVQIEILMH